MGLQDYTLGKGKVSLALIENGVKGGERYVGNSTEFNLNIESEQLEHMSSDEGINQVDDSVTTQITRSGTLTLDNINEENLALFMLGEVSDFTQDGNPVTAESLGQAEPGLSYQLGETFDNPQGVRDVTGVTVTVDPAGTTPITAVEGTDYTLDAELGRITFLEGGAADGTKLVEVDYTPTANTRKRIVTGASASIEVAVRFISTNPRGPKRDILLPKVTLSPSGDWGLKGDEWQTLGFSLNVGKNTGQAAIYIDGRPAA